MYYGIYMKLFERVFKTNKQTKDVNRSSQNGQFAIPEKQLKEQADVFVKKYGRVIEKLSHE
jgi:hypothetical protein